MTLFCHEKGNRCLAPPISEKLSGFILGCIDADSCDQTFVGIQCRVCWKVLHDIHPIDITRRRMTRKTRKIRKDEQPSQARGGGSLNVPDKSQEEKYAKNHFEKCEVVTTDVDRVL